VPETQDRISPIAETAPSPWQGRFIRWMLALLLLPPVLLALWTWAALHISYSSGERAGFVQKISRKGWLCKSWEGELAMATIPGTMPQIFSFSVRDDAVAQQVSQTIGQRVQLTYEQHKGIPTSCFGETDYFVTAVRPVSEAAVPSAGAASAPTPSVPR
jgi:hypothetical protein